MRKRYLTVPKNKNGENEYDSGIESSSNLKVFELPESEFETLMHSGIFRDVNIECGTLIDDYESEIITKDKVGKCLNIIGKHAKEVPVFY